LASIRGCTSPAGGDTDNAKVAAHPESTGPGALQRTVPELGNLWEDAGMRAKELLEVLEFWRK